MYLSEQSWLLVHNLFPAQPQHHEPAGQGKQMLVCPSPSPVLAFLVTGTAMSPLPWPGLKQNMAPGTQAAAPALFLVSPPLSAVRWPLTAPHTGEHRSSDTSQEVIPQTRAVIHGKRPQPALERGWWCVEQQRTKKRAQVSCDGPHPHASPAHTEGGTELERWSSLPKVREIQQSCAICDQQTIAVAAALPFKHFT